MANKIIVIKCDMTKNLRILHVPKHLLSRNKIFGPGKHKFLVPTEDRHAPLVITDTGMTMQ